MEKKIRPKEKKFRQFIQVSRTWKRCKDAEKRFVEDETTLGDTGKRKKASAIYIHRQEGQSVDGVFMQMRLALSSLLVSDREIKCMNKDKEMFEKKERNKKKGR
ncbi:hypothetical protein NPIL_155411 [Nephila pilipes]|uniref:Uncharacterized protein n=1 Tax=Nephila pilipes TaxID=299642 RepID=A0A8X6T6N9_NEPPI|nr:hypothetical protein NPIL_155411 [Nephila pilipes]